MLDLVLRHCTLPDGRSDHDIGIEAGRIVAVQPALPGAGAEEIGRASCRERVSRCV